MKDNSGVTLIELLIVVAVITVLAVAGGLEFITWQGNYRIESQVKQVHSDLVNARTRAMQRNRMQFFDLTATNYQIYEDVNEDGVLQRATDRKTWPDPKPLAYPPLVTGVAVMDTKGLITTIPLPPPGTDATVRFDIGSNAPDYDCIVLTQTRIALGKWNPGTSVCDVK